MEAGLKITSWNVNGLTRCKLDDSDFVNKLCENDIIILYETWTNEHSDIEIDGYKSYNMYRKFQNRRARRCSGGIVIYIKDELFKGVKIVLNHYDTIIWLKLDKHFFNLETDIFLAGIYLWVENSPAYNVANVNLFDIIQQDIDTFRSQGSVFLTGDWNARVGTRRDYIVCDRLVDFLDDASYSPDTQFDRKSMDSTCNSHGLKLLDLCKATSFRIVNGRIGQDFNGELTYINHMGSSVIDYLLVNEKDFHCINNFRVDQFCEWSDHCSLSFVIKCRRIMRIDEPCERIKIQWNDSMKHDFRRGIIGRLTDFNDIVNNIDISSSQGIDQCIGDFTRVIKEVSDPLFSKTIKGNKPRKCFKGVCKKSEWFDDECREAKLMYKNSLFVFNANKNDDNRINLISQKSRYKRTVKSKRRKYEYNKVREIERMRNSKPRDFWKLFSKNNHNNGNKVPVEDFHTYFKTLQDEIFKVVNNEAEEFCDNHDFNAYGCRFEELDVPVTVAELSSVVKKLKNNKASGNDLLLNEYFIESVDILSAHLVDLFNAILNSGHFPLEWSKGIIVPVFKKNDPCDPSNYRGITLVSCFSKILTGILNKRISTWVENNSILSDAQFGFRKGRSTTDASFVFNAVIHKLLNEKKRLYCAFIDMRRAFDSVYLNSMWLKLYRSGIDGKLLRVVKNMYSQVKSCVKSCNSYSEYFKCAVGLKQGEIMSPILFAMFVDDLELFLEDNPQSGLSIDEITFILMLFADDMVIMGKTVSELQHSLNLLLEYCNTWGLEVNTAKTKIVVFRKRGTVRADEKWTYDNKEIEIVNDFNYLGTVFNYTGTFNLNQETLAGKGLKALNVLLNNTKQFDFKPKVLCQLFDAFVGATLNYGAEVWGFSKSKEIERIHLKFCKTVLNVKTSSCNMAVYGELGRYPLYVNRYVRIIKFWCKVITSDNIIISKLYASMINETTEKNNWAKNVKSLLDNYGFSYVWGNPSLVNPNTFHIVFKNRIIDVFKQTWFQAISTSSVLRTYIHFKDIFQIENYLNILPKKFRIVLSRLRLSSHKLQIEVGRYSHQRVDRTQRQCTMCNTADIEDEYHFVCVCTLYSNIRNTYIKAYYSRRPSMYKFIDLMKSNNVNILRNLCKFISEAFLLRNSVINQIT